MTITRTRRTLFCTIGAVLALAALTMGPTEAAFPGDRGRIAFSSEGDLYSMWPDGSDLRPITQTGHDDRWPRWSPDGADLAFVRDGDVYLLRSVDGPGPLVQLTGVGDVVGAPSWHPDGTRIAYARSNQGIWSVTIADTSTGEVIPAPAVTPAWSPRGDWIAYSDGTQLYRTNLTSAPVPLTIGSSAQSDQPSWCADGERIVYRSTDSASGTTGIAYLLPFNPAAGGGFVGGGLFYGTDSEPACRPDATPDAVLGGLPEVVITRRNSQDGSDIAVGPLPNSANGMDPWFRTLTLGDSTRNGEADWQPKLAWDVRVLETNTGTVAAVRVTVPASLPRPLTLSWSLSPLDAEAPGDYEGTGGSVEVGANQSEVIIPVTIAGDSTPESDEVFQVIVNFPGFATIAHVTIVDDDPRSDGPIAVDVAMDRSALYPHAGGLAASLPVLQDAEHVAFSADGARVAYRSRQSGDYEIWVADTLPPFSNATMVTTVAAETSGSAASRPAWSPDGSTIAFVVDGSSIWLMNADGTNKRELTAGDNPTWSPDGLRIAFNRGAGSLNCSSSGCGTSLHVIDATGQNEQKLVGYPAAPTDPIAHRVFPAWDPDWSPDGRYIAYTGQHFISFDAGYSTPRIMLLDLNSPIQPGPPLGPEPANPRPLVNPFGTGAEPCQAPAWAPGGDRLVYSCRNTNRPDALTPFDTLWIAETSSTTPIQSGLGGVSSDWGAWPPVLHPVVALAAPLAVTIAETDADALSAVPIQLSFFNEAAISPTEVHWQIVPEGATEEVDYSPTAGVLTFRPGEGSLPLPVIIHGDDEAEANESFLVCFSVNPSETTCRWSMHVTIRDDDSGNRAPVTGNDVVATAVNTQVVIPVLANDSDPDGDVLTLTAAGTPARGTATFSGGTITYTPQAGSAGVDHFLYSVSDGTVTAHGAVSVYVGDEPLPPPTALTITPPFLDFGVVPVGKTRDLEVTVTNGSTSPVPLTESWLVAQDAPFPFDAGDFEGCARVPVLNPGDSCTRRVRFWGGPDAGAASPAMIVLLDRNSFARVATIPVFASLGPADTGPNTPPTTEDDLAALAPGFDQILDALRNDSDADNDLLRLVAVDDPAHGTASVIPCAPLHRETPYSDCIGYTPDAGYLGIDAIVYTVSDGRGGTATGTYHVAVGNVVPSITAITPASGPTSGGQSVRITGSNFLYRSHAALVCGGSMIPLTITQRTDTEILATTSPAFAGLCDVQVRTLFSHTGQLAGAYRYVDESAPQADLSVSVTASPTSLNVGQEVTYDVVLSNLGPADAPTARLSVFLPTFDLNLVNLSAPGMSCSLAAGLTCDVTNFSAGTTRNVRIVATAGAAGPLTASFAVSSATDDPNPANNSATATVTAASGADLSIFVTAPPAAVAGGVLRYTVTVFNNGPSLASGVTITMPVHGGFTLNNVNSPGGPCILPILGMPGSVTCFLNAPMLIRGEYVMTIDVVPNAVGTLSNTFSVSGTLHDPNPADNQATVTVDVTPGADLAVTAVPSQAVVSVGDSLNYAVTVRNNGPATAPAGGITITGGLGYTIDEITLPGLSCSILLFTRTWTCGLGTLAPGATVQFAVNGRVTGSSPGTNTFAVGSAVPDPNPSNNTAVLGFDARPTVTINQAAGQTDPAVVAPVTFTVVFSEPVTGFGPADISFAGSTVGGTLTAAVTGSGATYTVSVSGMSGLGLVAVSIPAGAAVDSGGNTSAASTSTDRTVLYGLSSVLAYVTPSNGGNVSLTALNYGGSLTGLLLYARGTTWFAATRFTSLVISGQTATLEGFTTNNRFFAIAVRDGGSGQPDTFRLWVEGVEQTAGGAVSSGTVVVTPWAPDTRLRGWVDLHTHPMSNLAFGGKLFHGAPSVGSLMPAVQMPNDPECRFDERASSIAEALSQDAPTRGDALQSRCGDSGRNTIIKALEFFNGALTAPAGADGYPAFTHWPKWNDITHQKMWIDWIRRSWEGGQRVMVALSHNNRTLAELLGEGAAISGVRNDRASSDLQIEEIKRLVADHPDFMAVARTPQELHAIVQGGRLAVVLGVEIDRIGDFSTAAAPSEAAIDAEIDRLYTQGVRYVLPIHFVDNTFGDTAIHESLFNVLNFRENGSFFSVGCAQLSDGISFQAGGVPLVLGPFLLPGMPLPIVPPCVTNGTFTGHVNARSPSGLTPQGEYALRAMMRRGMIVDIDHMSNRAANRALAIATGVPGGGYPLTSGHSAVRDRNSSKFGAENSRSTTQLARIACLGGMFGLGTDGIGGHRWAAIYERGYSVMRQAFAPNGACPQATPLGGGFIGLGTDANSLIKTPPPPLFDPSSPPRFADIYNAAHPLNADMPELFRSRTGNRTWDYNIDGVAHYGMFVDFLRDVRMWSPTGGPMNGRQIVDDQMMYGADYFYRMWLKADTQKTRVQ